MKTKFAILAVVFVLLSCSVFAQGIDEKVEAYLFYGQGCPHCAKLELFLDDLKEEYPQLDVKSFEVYFNQENRDLLFEMSGLYNIEVEGVPVLFIDRKVIVGFSSKIGEEIRQEVEKCAVEGCVSPEDILNGELTISIVGDSSPAEVEKDGALKGLTFGAVTIAAAVDAINPCAFAVLIILLTTILAAKKRKRVLAAGLAFSLSIYISYFLMGIGLYSAVQATEITHVFYSIVAVLAIFIGLFNLKDYFWYGKWFIMEVPRSWRPKMKMLIKGVTSIPGAFLIGFVVSLFLLPCTSGPYIVILGLLAKATERQIALLYLVYYNLIFILPMLIITFAIGLGFTTTEEAEEWRQKKLKVLHLIAGIIILLLGICMLIALGLGVL